MIIFSLGTLFDVLFNLHKFLRFETRDPFQEKLKRDDGFASDWDRYAHHEYHRLAAEEEGYDTADGNMEVDSLLMVKCLYIIWYISCTFFINVS